MAFEMEVKPQPEGLGDVDLSCLLADRPSDQFVARNIYILYTKSSPLSPWQVKREQSPSQSKIRGGQMRCTEPSW